MSRGSEGKISLEDKCCMIYYDFWHKQLNHTDEQRDGLSQRSHISTIKQNHNMSDQQLKATYVSSDSRKVFAEDLLALPTDETAPSVLDKTAYFQNLRTNITKMQSDVNAFLTKRMEEDKAPTANQANPKRQTQEQKEEEMYGEEDPDED